MAPSPSPALLPACAFAAGIWAHAVLAHPPPVGLGAPLVALGIALGRRAGGALAAAAAGTLVGLLAAPPVLPPPGRVMEATGRVSEPFRSRFGGWSGRLRVDLVRDRDHIAPTRGGFDLDVELAPGMAPPLLGAVLRVRGPLARSAGYANERERPPGPLRMRVKAAHFLAVERPPGVVASLSGTVRAAARRPFEGPGRAVRPGLRVARAFVLGEADALEEGWRRALRRCGLAHLVAVSGFNVSLVALLAAAAAAGRSRAARLGAVVGAIALYVLAVGPAPSVVRASLMALLALGGLALGRVPRARQGLALVLAGTLAVAPDLLFDPGFQLSFAATAGLLELAPRWAERWSARLPRALALPLAASVAAQTGALPWSVAAFGDWSPLAPVFNLVAGPWAAAALASSIGWTLLALVAPPGVADLAARALEPLAWPLDLLAALPPTPWISTAWPGGVLAGLALSSALAALAEGGRWRRAAALALLGVGTNGHGPRADGSFEAFFVDVGQGDATLLTHGGEAVLLDGGGAPGVDLGGRLLLPLLADRGLHRVRLAVVTHTDRDHCQGLADLARHLPIEEAWAPAGAPVDPCLATLERWSRGGLRRLRAGEVHRRAGFRFDVLHPAAGTRTSGDNEDSLVLAVAGGGRRLLFTGDLGADGERRLLRDHRAGLRAEVLKVGHHGSARSSTAPFVAAVGARLAVLSAGPGNPFGHPAGSTIARLSGGGIRILRTDRDGGVALRWRARGPLKIDLPGSPRSLALRR